MMREYDNKEKAQVLRYAELAFHSIRSPLSAEEENEQVQIRQGLSLTHEEMLELAQRNLTGSDEC